MLKLASNTLSKIKQNTHASNTHGFTTIEVLVSLLLALTFSGIAVQSIVTAAAIRVRAQESSDAANWVKTDLNVITNQARDLGGYDTTTGTYSDIQTNRCLATNATAGFANLLQNSPDIHPNPSSADPIIGSDDTDTQLSSIGDRPYTIRRQTSISDENPQILRVEYDVYRGTNISTDPIIYSYYSEVIPGVTFACRQV